MLIDVSKPKTIPYCIEKTIVDFIRLLPNDNLQIIKGKDIQYRIDIACALDDVFKSNKIYQLYNNIKEILIANDILCFHATRLLNIDEVMKNGLYTNTFDRYTSLFARTLRELNFSDDIIMCATKCVIDEYKRKYSGRSPQLCFFTSLSGFRFEGGSHYNQFCQNVCGEMARWALDGKMPKVLQRLSEVGKQAIVEFSLSFSDILDYYQNIFMIDL